MTVAVVATAGATAAPDAADPSPTSDATSVTLEATWPDATMATTPHGNSDDWVARYDLQPTGLTCHASADSFTLEGGWGCYSATASGKRVWEWTATLTAASAEVFEAEGYYVSIPPAGTYVVDNGFMWPLDEVASEVLDGRTPIDEAMPLIRADLGRYDSQWEVALWVAAPWVILGLVLGLAVFVGYRFRRRRAAAAPEEAAKPRH
jgi:hypothetical protein